MSRRYRQRRREWERARRRSIRMAVVLGSMALVVMFASMYLFWSEVG